MSISRRDFCFGLLLCGAHQFFSSSVYAKDPRTWSQLATDNALPIVQSLNTHPFVLGLADGTLSRDKFHFYLNQNIFYLESYAKTLGAVAKRLTSKQHRHRLERWQKETLLTRDWTTDLLSRSAGGNLPSDRTCAAVELYRSYEARLAAFGSLGEALAVILPCFWVYEQVGLHVAKIRKTQGNPYIEWIGGYGEPSYSQTVKQALGIADEYAQTASDAERLAMTRAFVKACRMEALFFDAAWHQSLWPTNS